MAKFLLTLVFILLTLTHERVCAVSETGSGMWQSAHSAVRSLGDDAHSYLVSAFGKQAVDSVLQNIEDAADTLNAMTSYITELLTASEIEKLQTLFNTADIVFVAKLAMLVMSGCFLWSRARWLIRAVIRAVINLALLPLKFFFAFDKAFNKIKGVAKQIKEIKMKKKQK